MKNWHRALLFLLLAWAPAASCLGQTTGATAKQPAVAYAVDGSLHLATESGQVLRKIGTRVPIGDFAISPDLKTVVFAIAVPGLVGGPFFILDVASGAIEPMTADPYFNDDSVAGDPAEFYTDPEFSPDGKQVVFAAHSRPEGSELQLSGPLEFLNIGTRKISIVKSTLAPDGLPFGYIRNPHWSPDGKQILGNMEGHAFVTDAEWKPDPSAQAPAELMIPESEVSQAAASYGAYAIGWLGLGCVLYQAGEDPASDPARVFQLRTQGTLPAAEMLKLPEQAVRGMRGFSGRLRLFPGEAGFRVEGPGISWMIRGDSETTFVRLLPQPDVDGLISAECR
jgi:hypothetical protein